MQTSIAQAARRIQTFQALAQPTYRRLWLAAWLWYSSRMMELIILSWLVLELTDSPSQVALVGVSRMTPMFLLGLVAGSLADRFPKRRAMTAAQLVNVSVTTSMALLILTDVVQPWHAFMAVFVTGTAWTVDFSARRAYFSEIFRDDRLVNAVSLDMAALTGSALLGPLLGGTLISLLGFAGAYGVLVAMYLVGLALLLSMGGDGIVAAPKATRSVVSQVTEAALTIGRNRRLRTILLITVSLNFFGFPYLQMVPVIARDVLGAGSMLYGLLAAAAGLGALTGSLLIASRNVRRKGTVYSLGASLMVLGILLFALSPIYLLSWLLLIIVGLGMSGFGAMQPTLAMEAVPPEMRGRAMGAVALGIGASPLGMLVLGSLAELWGPQTALALLAGAGLAVIMTLRWRLRELRDQPS